MQKYVSDIITREEIESWQPNDIIRISTAVGTGKTVFATSKLATYAQSINKKIIYLVHRTQLRNQIEADIKKYQLEDVVEVITYQKLSFMAKHGIDLCQVFAGNYFVYDEYQFLVQDASFNTETEIAFKTLTSKQYNNINILISANNFNLNIEFDHEYINIKPTYDISDRISKAYKFTALESVYNVIDNILANTNDKIFYFCNSTKLIETIYNRYKSDTMLVVSKDNPLYIYSDDRANSYLAQKYQFRKRILLSTSAIDAGISLRDRSLKHIIVDEISYPQIYQIIGRKRILDNNDKFNLYIKEQSNRRITGYNVSLANQITKIDNLRNNPQEFYRQQGRSRLDNSIFYIDGTGQIAINKMGEYKVLSDKHMFEKYLEYGYINYIEQVFAIKLYNLDLSNKIDNIRLYCINNINKKYYNREDKQEIIDIIDAKKNWQQISSLKGLNNILLDLHLPYKIIKLPRETKTINGKRKNFKAIWQLVNIDK